MIHLVIAAVHAVAATTPSAPPKNSSPKSHVVSTRVDGSGYVERCVV
jgi:hypothetical protein